VFVRYRAEGEELARARLADASVLSFLPGESRRLRWPEWSPQSSRLVFQARAPGARGDDLWIWEPGEPREQPLAAAPERDEQWPAWSDDGRWLAYAFRDAAGTSGIERVEPATRRAESLAEAGSDDFFFRPAFAPDGASLVAQRRGARGSGSTLWLLAPGAAPRPLTDDPVLTDDKASFSRDGAWIVHARRSGAGRDVWMRRPGASEARVVAGDPAADEHSPRASPTRDELVYVTNAGGRYELVLQPLEGGEPRRLAGWRERDVLLARWSPDGERLALAVRPAEAPQPGVRPDPSRMSVVVVDRTGTVLLDVPGAMPAWMPAW
jgi:Tol biopolymer transport system component